MEATGGDMNARDVLKYGHLTVLGSINGLPEADWETSGVCGIWSVKDIIAHLASFELVLVDLLDSFAGLADTPMLAAFQAGAAFNDEQVDLRKHQPPAEALAEYRAAHERTIELVAQLSPATLHDPGTLPWYGIEYALDDFIVYTYYGHKREHCAQIAVFRDQIGR
jgi:uncharacterized protein (TIGR03083 family)